jgi:hypothetical protein
MRIYENSSWLFMEATGEGVQFKILINKPFKKPLAARQKVC